MVDSLLSPELHLHVGQPLESMTLPAGQYIIQTGPHSGRPPMTADWAENIADHVL